MKAPLLHVASMIFNEPLAIMPSKLAAILHGLGPRLTLDNAALQELMSPFSSVPPMSYTVTGIGGSGITFLDMPVSTDSRKSEKPYVLTPDGIAVIKVEGTLMKRFSFLSAASGCSSYSAIGESARAALLDPGVKAILLDCNTPGGTTHGCFELSEALFSMRGEKPIWGISNDLAASAGYALISACDRVMVTQTGGVGSIGVFALHMDQSGLDEKEGVKYSFIYAGAKKVDGNPHQPLSRSAQSDIQDEVDREYDMFVATVARNRNIWPGKVRATEAGVFYGENAMNKLADEVMSYDETYGELAAQVSRPKVTVSLPGNKSAVAEKGVSDNNAPNNVMESGSHAGMSPITSSNQTNESEKAVRLKFIAGKVLAQALEQGNADLQALASEYLQANPAEEPTQQEATMAKLDTTQGAATAPQAEAEEPKKVRAIAAAAKEEDDDDEEDDEDDEPKSRKSKKAAKAKATDDEPSKAATTKQIASMCKIAGMPDLALDLIAADASLDDCLKAINERQAQASQEPAISSYVTGQAPTATNTMSLDQTLRQVTASCAPLAMAPGSPEYAQARFNAMSMAIRANPQIYEGYMDERDRVIQMSPGGRGPALTQYVLGTQRRYMAQLGLSTAIADMPAGRAMF